MGVGRMNELKWGFGSGAAFAVAPSGMLCSCEGEVDLSTILLFWVWDECGERAAYG